MCFSSKVETDATLKLLFKFSGWADKIHGLTVPADGPHHVQVLHEPIGVAGQIIPWNFPLLMYVWKVGPALACGNTIVLKTAEQTPLSALYVSQLFHEASPRILYFILHLTRLHFGFPQYIPYSSLNISYNCYK